MVVSAGGCLRGGAHRGGGIAVYSVSIAGLRMVGIYFGQDSAMYVCIVTDYYPGGDLGQILREKREKQEDIEEEVIIYYDSIMITLCIQVMLNNTEIYKTHIFYFFASRS